MPMTNRGRRRMFAVALFLFAAAAIFAANITVPTMELATHGSMVGNVFALQTFGNMILQVDGGYKFGGSVSLGLTNDLNLEGFGVGATPPPVTFTGASIAIRQLFGLPLDLTYFVGENDIFANGAGFSVFGAGPIGTNYRGFMYFPTGPLYDGIYQVQGTGLQLTFGPGSSPLAMDLYAYEDTHNPPFSSYGSYSADARILLNTAPLKLEAFFGGTYSSADPLGSGARGSCSTRPTPTWSSSRRWVSRSTTRPSTRSGSISSTCSSSRVCTWGSFPSCRRSSGTRVPTSSRRTRRRWGRLT